LTALRPDREKGLQKIAICKKEHSAWPEPSIHESNVAACTGSRHNVWKGSPYDYKA
jgi:hypothetical protein